MYRVLLSAIALTLPFVAHAGEPAVRVPYSKAPVTLDGRVSDTEWSDAAVLRNVQVFGNARLAYPLTTIYLKYDAKNLWVAARCFETEKGYPKASKRGPTDLLTNDDSIQVVLGISDDASQSKADINYGGYAGATAQKACAADYYYQFTANSAGAVSRFFIEAPLDRPMFEAKTSSGKGYWTVEMRIPFASWGAVSPAGRTYPVNFFRFRPPDMTAWHLPGFGGYAPMPFGEIVFLPKDQADKKTVEPEPPASDTTGNGVRFTNGMPVESKAVKALSATLEYYALAKKIIGQIELPPGNSAGYATISMSAQEIARQDLTGGTAKIVALITDNIPLPATAVLDVFSTKGDNLLTRSIELPAHQNPDWLGTDAGQSYLDVNVPKPWTRPTIDGQHVKLYDKSIGFTSSALPSSVVDDLGELFAGSPVVTVEVNGKLVLLGSSKPELSIRGLSAQVICDQGALQTRSDVDFDGFTTIKMRLRGIDPASVSKFSVAFPIKKGYAKFFNVGNLQRTQALAGHGWDGPGSDIWLGNQDKGLWFSSDTPLFLSAKRRSQIQIVEEKGTTWLRFNFVDAAGQIADKDHIFRFFIQPTPTKKPSLAKSGLYGGKIALWFENWSDYEGYPDLNKMPEVAQHSADAHKKNQKQIVYFNQQLAENSPGFAEFKSDFTIPPGLMWYKRAYDPGKGVPCYVCCVHGPFGDLLLDGIRKLRDEGGIDGVYMDGTSVAWDCDNPSHVGCDGNATVGWDTNDITRVTGVRNFLKRLRGLFDVDGRQPVMVSHCGGGLDIPTLSLCDAYYEGEALARYRPEYSIPLHVFAVGYSGWQWGLRTDMIPALWSSQTARLLPLSLLHDTQVGGSSSDLEQKIYTDYSDDATVKYYPYWRTQPHAKKIKGDVLFSYYHKADSTMLIVSNLTRNKQACALDLNGLYPGKTLNAVDVARDSEMSLPGNIAKFSLGARSFIALRLSTDGSVKAQSIAKSTTVHKVQNYTGTVLSDWDINKDDPGVSLQSEFNIGDSKTGIRIGSVIYQSAANASFKLGVADQGTLKLKIMRSGRFTINIAGAGLTFDGASIPSASALNLGSFNCPAANPEKPETLVASWHDGLIDVTYGEAIVAKNLSLNGLGKANTLQLTTWAGDWFAFDVMEISDKPINLFPKGTVHPVM